MHWAATGIIAAHYWIQPRALWPSRTHTSLPEISVRVFQFGLKYHLCCSFLRHLNQFIHTSWHTVKINEFIIILLLLTFTGPFRNSFFCLLLWVTLWPLICSISACMALMFLHNPARSFFDSSSIVHLSTCQLSQLNKIPWPYGTGTIEVIIIFCHIYGFQKWLSPIIHAKYEIKPSKMKLQIWIISVLNHKFLALNTWTGPYLPLIVTVQQYLRCMDGV